MRKLFSTGMFLALVAGGWLFFKHFRIEGLEQLVLRPRANSDGSGGRPTELGRIPPPDRERAAIRIASYNIQVFGERKAAKPQVMEVLADTIRQFDVVAVQEIRALNQSVVPRFVDLINSTGRHYDYVLGERQGRTHSKEQYAFIYDAQSVEVDRSAAYSVGDPDDLLHRPPLVVSFRVRGPPAEEAFTFTLVNVHTDPDEVDSEVQVLDDVFREVRSDGRGEDDVILLGDFNADEKHFGELGEVSGIRWLVAGAPTNTKQTKTYDNLLIHGPSTVEFTGRSGVVDMVRQFNLTLDEAMQVSDHLPVWGEFAIYEGGDSRPVAGRTAPVRPR